MSRSRKPIVPAITEHTLQKQVADHLSAVLREPVWWSAIDHAGKLGARQAADRKRRGVKRGIADILVMWSDARAFPRSLWIELKRPGGGSLSLEQKAFDLAMEKCGAWVRVCRSIEEVDAALAFVNVPRLQIVGRRRAA